MIILAVVVVVVVVVVAVVVVALKGGIRDCCMHKQPANHTHEHNHKELKAPQQNPQGQYA